MEKKILDHYRQYSQFTYPGLYESYLQSLPDNVRELGALIRHQLIHRTSLHDENTKKIPGLIYADMTNMPWWRQAEDDNFNTAVSIIAELFRRDKKGFTMNRKDENKLVLTCRHTTLLMASILKAKRIPARVRSGYAPYFPYEKGVSSDHWINEYWDAKQNRWVIIDVDGHQHKTGFDMFDLPSNAFDYPAISWLNSRNGKDNPDRFYNASGVRGLEVISWALFYDFHCLMSNEIIYVHNPSYIFKRWDSVTEEELKELDELARLLLEPDKNFDKLSALWNTEKKFRLLTGGLL